MKCEKQLPVYGEINHHEEKMPVPANTDMGSMLWDVYASVYDGILRHSIPYRQLVQEVCESCRLSPDGQLLDAGCGTGNFLQEISRLPLKRIVGLDSSPAMLGRARKKLRGLRSITLQQGDLNHPLPFAERSFDGVICINVLYSTKNPFYTLAQLNRVLKKGGRMVLVTPPVKPRMLPIFVEQARAFQKKYPLGWPLVYTADLLRLLPYMPLFLGINVFIKEHNKFHFFNEDELIALAQAAGFDIEVLKKTYAGQGWFMVGTKTR